MRHHSCAGHREAQPEHGPQQESAMLSVNICRSRRRRPAPSAARMASSLCRAPRRANCRFERFAQTTNITTPTAHASTSNAGRTGPLTYCSSGTSLGKTGFLPILVIELLSQRRQLSLRVLHCYAGQQLDNRYAEREPVFPNHPHATIARRVPGVGTDRAVGGAREHGKWNAVAVPGCELSRIGMRTIVLPSATVKSACDQLIPAAMSPADNMYVGIQCAMLIHSAA